MYDFLFAGFTQPLIGTFSISIGDIKKKIETTQSNFLKSSQRLLNELRKKERLDMKSLKDAISVRRNQKDEAILQLKKTRSKEFGDDEPKEVA